MCRLALNPSLGQLAPKAPVARARAKPQNELPYTHNSITKVRMVYGHVFHDLFRRFVPGRVY